MDRLKEIINKGISENYFQGNIDDIRENLAEYGVNLNENSKRQDKLIKQLKFKLRASINEEKDNILLAKVAESFQEAIIKGLERPVAYLNELVKDNRVYVQYSNLKKLDANEIKEIIKDQNLIEIIELLENEQ